MKIGSYGYGRSETDSNYWEVFFWSNGESVEDFIKEESEAIDLCNAHNKMDEAANV